MRLLIRTLAMLLLTVAPASAQDMRGLAPPPIERFRPLPFHEIAASVAERYAGRMVAAQTRPPSQDEREKGAELIYEFRLVTPQRNLLIIRIDARTGRFMEVAGHGQVQARIPQGSQSAAGALSGQR